MKADKIVGAKMMRRFLHNRKGTAEVIGSVMFIVILLFFFTNVYLWHDAATKEMNQMYVEKINTPVTVSLTPSGLNVTNVGGMDTTISMVWVIVHSPSGGSDLQHNNFTRNDVVQAGKFIVISDLPSYPTEHVTYKVVTTTGNIASRNYP